MPFADARGLITVRLQQRCDGHAVRCYQRRGKSVEHARLQMSSPGVAPRERRVARRRTNTRRRVRIGETHPLRREFVEMGRRDFRLCVKAGHVPVTKIVGEDENNVGFGSSGSDGVDSQGKNCCECDEETFHAYLV